MHDPFEESLRGLLKQQPSHDDGACLARVLRKANRQVGAGQLLGLLGAWQKALLIALNSGAPVSTSNKARRERAGRGSA